ncbi:hypothetical protein [Cerasicoccus frondis]|uniref:hypothetical protein n=1 Tax=Cerasicoccus frondis TaxID=490090 RepID=UPI002852D467|nr:hypothetical protein [Cerasicoccus frondis]
MAYTRRSLICHWLVLLILPLTVQAQRAEDVVEYRVTSLDNISEFLCEIDGDERTVYASLGALSPALVAPDNRKVEYYDYIDAPDPKLPPIKRPLAQFKLPAGVGPFLTVLSSTESGQGLPYSAIVFDQSLESHPSGQFKAYNFSKRRIAMRVGEHDLILQPGETGLIPYPADRKVWIKVAIESAESGWILTQSSPVPVSADTRTTLFVVDIPPSERDPNPKGVVLRKMRERVSTL